MAVLLAVLGFLSLMGRASAALPACDPTDPQCDPPPSESVVLPAGSASIPAGTSSCCRALSANNSAGIGGYISAAKPLAVAPKINCWWDRTGTEPQLKIYSQKMSWDSTGYFQVVLNKSNGYAADFPGVFQFCIRNPASNPTIYILASCVTY